MRRILTACFLLLVVGCGPQRPTEFTVSGKSLEYWLTGLKAEEIPVREKAVKALSNVGTAAPEVIPALMDALEDSAASVRAKAALALLKIGPDAHEALDALTIAAQHDTDPDVRLYASRAIAKINGDKSML